MENTFDAIVIGGGPAGSTAGILLASAGWRVAIVEKDRYPRDKVCGGCIAASNLPLLETLGIGDRFHLLASPPLPRMALNCRNCNVYALLPPSGGSPHPWGVALRRAHLDSLLLEQARQRGTTIYQPWLVTSVEGSAGDFHCHMRKAGTSAGIALAAPVLIDAHGSWQVLHHGKGVNQRPRNDADLLGFKADFFSTHLEHGVLQVLSFPGGYGGMVVTDHGMVTLAFCIQRRILADARVKFPGHGPQEAAAQWVMRHCDAVRHMMHGAVQEAKWIAAGPIYPGIRVGRLAQSAFMVGNAAGETHPIIGEGISMAIQSAALLANLLGPPGPQTLDSQWQARIQRDYAQAWRRHFATRIRLAAVFAHVAMRPWLCAGLFPLLKHYPGMLSQFALWSGKVRPGPRLESGQILRGQ